MFVLKNNGRSSISKYEASRAKLVYKYALPFQYEKDVIEKFFTEHPKNIKMQEFEELVK